MYASIRKYRTNAGAAAELVKRVEKGFVPMVGKAPGFVAYYVIDAGDDVVASVSVFQNQAGAEESNRLAAAWVKENIAALVAGAPDTTAGAVAVHKTA